MGHTSASFGGESAIGSVAASPQGEQLRKEISDPIHTDSKPLHQARSTRRLTTIEASGSASKTTLYPFLSNTFNGNLRLDQVEVLKFEDDWMFEYIRSAYLKIKGWLRRFWSVWIYLHCDFFELCFFQDRKRPRAEKKQFGKSDIQAVAPGAPGVPASEIMGYMYIPIPVRQMPSISAHEFKSRFHACTEKCLRTNPF